MQSEEKKIMNKVMNKNVKRMIASACAGVIGLGVAASPVMAAAPTQDTEVFYTTDAAHLDKDGKVMMVIPASVSLTQKDKEQAFSVVMKTTDPLMDLPDDFTATLNVQSKNKGKLKSDSNTLEADYKLYTGKVNAGQEVVLTGNNAVKFADFKTNKGTGEATQEAYVQITDDQALILEGINQPGTQFTDTLTFTATNISGSGITGKQ